MADIENPLATAAPERSRHGFWAWWERFELAYLTITDLDAVGNDGDVRADGDQGSRIRFLCWWTLLELAAIVGFALLLAIHHVVATVVGYAGLTVAAFLLSFLAHLWGSVAEGKRDDQRIIDSMM